MKYPLENTRKERLRKNKKHDQEYAGILTSVSRTPEPYTSVGCCFVFWFRICSKSKVLAIENDFLKDSMSTIIITMRGGVVSGVYLF